MKVFVLCSWVTSRLTSYQCAFVLGLGVVESSIQPVEWIELFHVDEIIAIFILSRQGTRAMT
jgi:hypothetical protein